MFYKLNFYNYNNLSFKEVALYFFSCHVKDGSIKTYSIILVVFIANRIALYGLLEDVS